MEERRALNLVLFQDHYLPSHPNPLALKSRGVWNFPHCQISSVKGTVDAFNFFPSKTASFQFET